ncbi:kinase-like domain-containing protein [Boletus edulis BED1]|uniref:non-specific serine/threonine protein kinase n=1 Tax=Boletus edulis BED1 TaxID=1328754 RepID=A0AAD4C961_BOLED|nr:kinase-like domain-containing protein [Boletus edulis BED1]
MLTLLRVAAAPVTLEVSHYERPPLVAICHLKEVNSLATDIRRLSFSTRSIPVRDIESDSGSNTIAHPDTSPGFPTTHFNFTPTTYSCSIFPVYGPFDLLYCIQNGGFASAWAARDQTTGRLLCLKMFKSLQDPNVSRSAKEELRIFRYMVKSKRGEKGRQFIIELNKSFLRGTDVFFAMELMTTDLGTYFEMEPERCKLHARRWMAQIALGIQSLHEMGIIHRDMKSENILIDSRENIRIIDFGLAYIVPKSRDGRRSEGPTHFLGTPPYMAPEVLQIKGLPTDLRKPYGTAVDWWALGCILFELESRNHEGLFDTEEDVQAYVAWNEFGQLYPRYEGLDFVVVDLLEGLLDVQPSTRYSLSDMEKHDYFLRRDGTSEFDNAAAKAVQRPIRPQLVPHFAGDDRPIEVVQAKDVTAYDWTNLKWAHPLNG